MSIYSLDIYAASDVLTSVAGILGESVTGAQWDWHYYENPTLTVSGAATPTSVQVSDTDASQFTFDDGGTQTLTADLTINGITYPAGTELQDEYEIVLQDEFGTQFTMVAISAKVYTDQWNWTEEIIGVTWDGAAPPTGTTLSYVTLGGYTDNTYMAVCYTPGTLIETVNGARRIEMLRPGDGIVTLDHGIQPLRWIGTNQFTTEVLAATPDLCPVVIEADTFGPGMPHLPLVVSPQHRVLVNSKIAERISGADEVLVAAKHLLEISGISQDMSHKPVRYIHLFFDRHEVLFANGLPAESLFPGEEAIKGLPKDGMSAIRRIADQNNLDLSTVAPARPFLSGRQGRALARRHRTNGVPLLAHAIRLLQEI